MSSAETSSEGAAGTPPVMPGEMKLEVVVLPVSDVDRAKALLREAGVAPQDADLDGRRWLQGGADDASRSGCSIIFGEGVTSVSPGTCPGTAALGLRHRRGPRRPDRPRGRGQRGLPRRDRGSSITPVRGGARLRPGPGTRRLRLVRRLQRPGRQRLADAGDPDPASGSLMANTDSVGDRLSAAAHRASTARVPWRRAACVSPSSSVS